MSSDLFREDALTFQSASNSSVGQPTGVLPPSWSLITLLLTFFMMALSVFLFNVDFARRETARGKLRVDGAEAKIYPLESGLVTDVFVEDGALVTIGDSIATITSDRFLENGAAFSKATLDALAMEREALDRRRDAVKAGAELSKQAADAQFQDAKRREADAAAQLDVAKRQLSLARSRAIEAERLLAKGLIVESEFNQRDTAAAQFEQSVLRLQGQIGEERSVQRRSRLEKRQIMTSLERDLSEIDQRSLQIDNQIQRSQSQASHVLHAPITGRVTALQARVGEQAVSSIPLAVILPENGKLIAEVYLTSRAIGFVQPGQEVKLQYDAFPYQKFGVAQGEVKRVASTAQLPQEIGINSQTGEPLYRVEIALNKQTVEALSKEVPLQAGMELSADIVLENRRLLEWLLEPIGVKG